MKLGIATIYQELDLVDGLSVAENIFLGHEDSRRRVHPTGGDPSAAARDLLRRLGHAEIPPGREVGRLSAAGKQIVSMARALSHDARLIVMDEPSAVLDSDEVDEPVPRHPRPDRAKASPSSTSRTGSRRSARSATGSPSSRTAARSPPACRRRTPRPPS